MAKKHPLQKAMRSAHLPQAAALQAEQEKAQKAAEEKKAQLALEQAETIAAKQAARSQKHKEEIEDVIRMIKEKLALSPESKEQPKRA
jgi:hypothetical protein